MTKSIIVFILLFLACPVFYSPFVIAASDDVTTEISVSEFHSIHLEAEGDLYIKQGEKEKLTVTTDEDVIPSLHAVVKDGLLTITLDQNAHATRLDIYVTVKDLKGLSLNTSFSDIQTEGTLKVDEIAITNNGNGEIRLNLEANKINTELSSTGEIILSGKTKEHNILLLGTGEVEAFDLCADSTTVDSKGTGTCSVNVVKKLKVELWGTGEVIYKGNPEVDLKDYGMGSCTKCE